MKFNAKRIISRLSSEQCKCEHHTLCDTYQNRKQTDQNKDNPVDTPSQYELENVHKVYNEIAGHFSETRHSPWPQVTEFIQQFPVGSILVDVGCGNGKYLQSNPNIFEVIDEKGLFLSIILTLMCFCRLDVIEAMACWTFVGSGNSMCFNVIAWQYQ